MTFLHRLPRLSSINASHTYLLILYTHAGICVYVDGTRYEGAFAKDKRHGERKRGGREVQRKKKRESDERAIGFVFSSFRFRFSFFLY